MHWLLIGYMFLFIDPRRLFRLNLLMFGLLPLLAWLLTGAPVLAALAVATAVGHDEIAFTNSHWAFSQRELQALMANMDIIATQRLFPGVEVEMAHHHNRVDIEHGPIHFAIREDQLQLTPYEPHK